jgi:hypothetical protein
MNNLIKILPAAAIVVGLVGSAFTSTQKAPTKSAQQQLHWYEYDSSSGTVGQALGDGNPITKDDAMLQTGCDQPSDNCARGYSAPQTENHAPNPAEQVDAIGFN